MKKIFLSFLALLLGMASMAFSETKTFSYDGYSLKVCYADLVYPGDPVFIRLDFLTVSKKFIKKMGQETSESGNLEVYRITEDGGISEKALGKALFYQLEKNREKKRVQSVLLAAIPLSTYVKAGRCLSKITFSAFGQEEKAVEIGFEIGEKRFVSETIPLNVSNTKIRANYSSERMNQIDRLNNILDTKNYDAVYETGSFAPPTPAVRRTSFFGDRRIFAYSNGKSSTSLHYGIDYGVPTGSEVRACGRGRVVMAEDRISTGWSVCIEHLPGLYSLYYHMSRLDVEVGQTVERGELLGLSGATGLATGPHLHWEVRLNMEAINPDFMTRDFAFSQQ